MTCIIGYVDRKNRKSYVGSDHALTSETYITRSKKNMKIWKCEHNEDIIIAVSGTMVYASALRIDLEIPSKEETDKRPIDEEYIYKFINTQITKIRKECDETLFDENNVLWMLIAYKDRIFEIENNLNIIEHEEDYLAIGSGTYVAMGALDALADMDMPILAKINKGFKSAERLAEIQGPYTILEIDW